MTLDWWRFGSAVVITALALLVEHYKLRDVDLTRIWSYTIGTATIWAGLAIWLAPSLVFWLSLAFPFLGGAAVAWAYHDDEFKNLKILVETLVKPQVVNNEPPDTE